MSSIVFAKYITREFNSDVAGNTLHTDDKLREHSTHMVQGESVRNMIIQIC